MPKDYGKTLNLPKTDFSMRANLPQREPATQEKWATENIYEKYHPYRKSIAKPKQLENMIKMAEDCSKDFNGTNTDSEVIKLAGISRNSYYKYKAELKEATAET